MIVTEFPVRLLVATVVITGAGAEPVVVKVKLPEALAWAVEFVETTSKL